jgi:hypothetical protein
VNGLELWSYRLRSTVDSLGRVGGLGAALLFGCAVFYVSAVRPVHEELTVIQERRASDELARRSGRVALDTPAQLREFIAFFPEVDSSSRWLALIFTAARDEGLELAQGTYRLQSDDVLGIASYQVTLPVRGSYPHLRRFLGRVLTEVPAASLDGVTFQRERSADGLVDARIVIALHLRDGSQGGRAPSVPAEPPKQEARTEAGERVLAKAEAGR